ncbi:MAG: lipid-A-disaccharide synthase [Salinivirgaceae bacterium]|nr:lipid-A-disaccharide synthase [Salinivirgaceae bacterium]
MKYYVIAGEASGDLHAANLIRSLKMYDPDATIRGWGGDMMKSEGAEIVANYKNMAYMGYAAVIKNLRRILQLMEECKKDIVAWNPDVVILVDYPGFNLKIAKFTHSKGFKTYYYIAPKIWAWKGHRIKAIKKYIDNVYSILPFEIDFYKKHNYSINYVGNPLLDSLTRTLNRNQTASEFIDQYKLSGKPIIALLPGSRKQEIKALLPTMASIANKFPNHEFVISGAPGIDTSFYDQISNLQSFKIIFADTYQLLLHAEAALVASGTATLEAALIGTPQVVCYKLGGGRLAHFVGKIIFRKIKYVSLVNLILGKLSVTELLQHHFNKKELTTELQYIIKGGKTRTTMLNDYSTLQQTIGKPGASERAAQNIIETLQVNR